MYLFFDTETTGKPKNYNGSFKDLDNWPRITQFAWQSYNAKGEKIKSFQGLVKPDNWTIPVEQFFIDNNMSTERCEKEGMPILRILEQFTNEIDSCKFILAHNLNFDLGVTASEMYRLNLTSLNKPVKICTMQLTTEILKIPGKYGFKWPSLTELHNYLFGSDFDSAHDASGDVSAMAKCFFELKKQNLITI